MSYEKSMLIETIGDSIENRIIDFLLEGKGIDYSKTDIADGCEISRPTIYKMLPGLIKEGIVKKTRTIGRVTLYQINDGNQRVRALMELERILLKKSFAEIEGEKTAVATP